MNRTQKFILPLLAVLSMAAHAQQVFTGQEAAQKFTGTDMVRTGKFSETPTYIRFEKGKEISYGEWKSWITEKFSIPFNYDFTLIKSETDKLGHIHYRMQQTLNGIEVENGIWIIHTQNGRVYSMNGLLFTQVNASMSAALTEAQALSKALAHVNATTYKWELPGEEEHLKRETKNPDATYFPNGELTYTSARGALRNSDQKLTYKFNIYAHKPVSRAEIYVDAITGAIVNTNQVLHDADVVGTAHTKYSGVQPMTADSYTGGYRLRESGRGDGIETYNMLTGTDYNNAVDFTDADNVWNNVNAQEDEVATDAHWGAEMTYDYFLNEHGRNSIDGAGFNLISYVHYDVNFVNAFWDGQRMTYGDGQGAYNPFTALDITGHEIGHGLTEFTANLVYQDESGALNESFSDIFGTCIEFYGKPTLANWFMGENIGVTLRSMSNPNTYGDPDTYFGNNWAPLGGPDNGGVHTNSSVQNFWFYLLSQGGNGTNDNGDVYSVTGIGRTLAAEVAFRNLTVYLSNNSQYDDARFYSIQSATDLFGPCSPEVQSVTNAWYAVGVGPAYVAFVTANFAPSTNGGCATPLTVNFTNTSINGVNYTWDFGDGQNSSLSNPSHTYSSNGVYNVSLIADGGLCGTDTLLQGTQIFVGQLPNPVAVDAGRCDAGTVNISASGSGDIIWYANSTGGPALDTASIFTTPAITGTTTFYAEAVTGINPEYVGPTNNNIGAGGYTTNDRWLIFDAQQPFTLVSVWIFANGAGNRTIQLRDNAGTVLQSAVINCPNGGSRITLNFPVPAGTNMQLGTIAGTPSTLYRNSAGVNYPYTINNLVSITSSNSGGQYYYYFYDWEIQTTPCVSNRVPVVAAIAGAPLTTSASRCGAGSVTMSATGSSGVLYWYDAPVAGNLVNTGTSYTTSLSSTTTYYVEEEVLPLPAYVGPVDNTFGGGGFFNGDQHLVFDVFAPCTLKSVKVFANGAGNRTVELRNSAGTVVNTITAFVPDGTSRITLNFPLTPGTDYELGWPVGSAPDLYRNNTGAPAYPFTLAGLVSITTSSPGTGYYYGYYDWEVQGPGCTTPRTPVTGTVNTQMNAAINAAGPFCSADGPTILTAADAGGIWTGTGITNGTTGEFNPSSVGAGVYNITYTISGTCGDAQNANVTVTNMFDASITSTPGTQCTGGNSINLTAVDAGGTWTGTGITNGTSGTFDPATAGAGTYDIIYTIGGVCGNADTTSITVATSQDATITTTGPYCINDPAVTLTAVDPGGIFTGTGVSGGMFNPATAGAGLHLVTYTISGACGATDVQNITVNPLANAAINTPPATSYCVGTTSVNLTAVQSGGTWSANCGGCINPTTGVFNPTVATPGNWQITYTINGPCGNDSETMILSVEDCSGITETEISFGVQVMPNPASEFVTLNVLNAQGNEAQMEIRNSIGQLVWNKKQLLNGSAVQVNTSVFSTGMYTVHVMVNNQRAVSKLVIE